MSAALFLVIVEPVAEGVPRTAGLVESVTKDARGGLCLKGDGRTMRYFYPGTFGPYALHGPYSSLAELMDDEEIAAALKTRLRAAQQGE